MNAVPGALDDAPVMDGDGGIDQIAAQCPQPRKRAILVHAREPAVADHVGDQDRGDLPGFGHGAPLRASCGLAQKPLKRWLYVERAKRSVDRRPMTGICVRREKAALSSGCKSYLANVLQPEATGAVMEVTKWLKPSVWLVT